MIIVSQDKDEIVNFDNMSNIIIENFYVKDTTFQRIAANTGRKSKRSITRNNKKYRELGRFKSRATIRNMQICLRNAKGVISNE